MDVIVSVAVLVVALGILGVALALLRRRPASPSTAASEIAALQARLDASAEQVARLTEREEESGRIEQLTAEAKAQAAQAARLEEQAAARAEELGVRAEALLSQARQRSEASEAQAADRVADIERRESRLRELETRVDAEITRLEVRRGQLAAQEEELAARETELAGAEARRLAELERVAGLTADDARAEVVSLVEARAKRDAATTVREIEQRAKEEGEARARRIVTLAAQRIASEATAESTVSVLHLPDDSMKGRIIGREGRNIRTFESVTGVDVVIDDTPEAVLLSSFDPVRREVARLTLETLVADGRIQPSRIEEVHERSLREIEARCIRAGEDAWYELGLGDVHPEIIATLGRLRYRTSYGQNVLGHLIESGYLAGIMAAELGLPVEHARRCAVLHDIGKALTHEVEGSHALIGAELARRYGEDPDVVHAIEAHHNEVEPRTLEAVLTQAADAISGSRPGARRESLEHYVERLERLETIAAKHQGVDKVFAMQAGREVRVVVLPEAVDDLGAQVLARDIAHEIEDQLTYPGQIRVTVVRESRATGLAR